MDEQNKAMAIGDLAAQMFRPASSPEAEMLDTISKFTFQLRLDQQIVLNRLVMASYNENINLNAKQAIEAFIPLYSETKKHHDTREFISHAVDGLSLKRFVEGQQIKGQIIKTGQ